MSADKWTACPMCREGHLNQTTEMWTAAGNAYGKVPEDDYRALREEARLFSETPQRDTLREDYEVGTDADGNFSVSYSSHCEACGYSFEYRVDLSAHEIAAITALKNPTPITVASKKPRDGRGRSSRRE